MVYALYKQRSGLSQITYNMIQLTSLCSGLSKSIDNIRFNVDNEGDVNVDVDMDVDVDDGDNDDDTDVDIDVVAADVDADVADDDDDVDVSVNDADVGSTGNDFCSTKP